LFPTREPATACGRFSSFYLSIPVKKSVLFLLFLLFASFAVGCGGSQQKGKNKDKDKPKPTAMLSLDRQDMIYVWHSDGFAERQT